MLICTVKMGAVLSSESRLRSVISKMITVTSSYRSENERCYVNVKLFCRYELRGNRSEGSGEELLGARAI